METSTETIAETPRERLASAVSEDLGARLRRLRAEKAATQDEAAAAAGVKPITLSRWERGVVDDPDTKALGRLARFYGTTVDRLLGSGVAEEQAPYVAIPESFHVWKTTLAPAGLVTPEVERRMIQTGLRYSRSTAWRWSNVLAEVLVDMQEHKQRPQRKRRR